MKEKKNAKSKGERETKQQQQQQNISEIAYTPFSCVSLLLNLMGNPSDQMKKKKKISEKVAFVP